MSDQEINKLSLERATADLSSRHNVIDCLTRVPVVRVLIYCCDMHSRYGVIFSFYTHNVFYNLRAACRQTLNQICWHAAS